ncbi:RNA polymerase sigma factor [Altibacter sp. HG106]|uniref:RNA polymerase sigma factor n=1 Tax=Altibacter sp. HG106 TaxID=3023937 RepID=UPI002350B3CE|nr:sigma-70 family RNA polymerase sigma factor [Altibacter sp. HG106]MDC7994496.1 sigma-70 family RNA polymerase sigma factor [Altibacter sp. HG106]
MKRLLKKKRETHSVELNELIDKCKKKERTAQKELFLRYKDDLYFLSLKYCRNQEQAEDNVHDTFIEVFQKIHTYKGTGSFEGWMKRMAIFKAIDKFKKGLKDNITYNPELGSDAEVAEETIECLSLSRILSCIQKLPDQYRLVFNLYQLDGFTHKEIARELGISEGTSNSNYHRAKKLLKKEINHLRQQAS